MVERSLSEQDLGRLLSDAVDAVLETMFFSMPFGPAEPETGTPVLESRVSFRGRISGTLGVCLSTAAARILAAGFLGEEEEGLSDTRIGEVFCELANMLCGSLASRLESDESFDLTSPELVPAGNVAAACSEALSAARQSFELENGILTVTLCLQGQGPPR